MAKGDHIFLTTGETTRHGIHCADDTVIECAKESPSSNATVRRIPIQDFAGGQRVEVVFYQGDSNPPDVTVQRAEARIGQADHAMYENDSHKFAVWCKAGKADEPVESSSWGYIIGGVIAVGAAVGSWVIGSKSSKA